MERITIAFLERAWWQQVLLIAVAAIFYIQLAGFVGTNLIVPLIEWGEGVEPAQEKASNLEGRFVRWDSGYYLTIAQNGYRADGFERAFFPLYPLISYTISAITGLPLLWSGLLISIACYLGACLLIYKLVLLDYKAHIARWTVIWVCAFPMSFFFVAFYAEPLFLLAEIASLYFARRGQFISSCLALAVAGATRPIAFLLAIPFILEFWNQHNFAWIHWLKFGLGALIAPLGMLSYLFFLAWQAGSSNLFTVYASIHANEWHREYSWPWVTLYDGVNAALFGTGIHTDWFSRAIVWQNLTYALLGLLLALWALFYLRQSLALFLLLGMLFLYAERGPDGYAFDSDPRAIAALFPVYLVLALLTVKLFKPYRWLILTVSVSLLGLLSAWFASGRWVS